MLRNFDVEFSTYIHLSNRVLIFVEPETFLQNRLTIEISFWKKRKKKRACPPDFFWWVPLTCQYERHMKLPKNIAIF